jgi:ABC-type Na+ efflux pump permease subunit
MTSFPQTLMRIRENPVAQAELKHQQRDLVLQQKWKRFPTLFGMALGIGIISYLALHAAPLLTAWIAPLVDLPQGDMDAILRGWFDTITLLSGALIMIHHLSFATAALQLAATSISREKHGRTWESLLLTGVDARKIIFGKWSATMRTLWQAYRPLLFLRFAIALWMGATSGTARFSSYFSPPSLLDMILIGAITALFPLCYAGFTVMLGLLASLLVHSETAAHRVASALHFGTTVVSLCFILITFALPYPYYSIDQALVSMIPALFVTPLDGGMLALIGMIASNGSVSRDYLFGLILCVALYAGLMWLGLRGAQALAVRQRALPPR